MEPLATIAELARGTREGHIDPGQTVLDCLARIAGRDPELRSFVLVDAERAQRCADSLRAEQRAGRLRGRLAGVPFAIKDNFALAGQELRAGSRILHGYVAPYTATCVQRLLAEGAIPIGRTRMDEFGFGCSTEHHPDGPARHPLDPQRSPGGSSGGSAAAVAAGLVSFALGSDTGGGVRQPAAWCGVPGLKPSYGRVSRFGLVAFASSLDCVGLFARRCEEIELLLSVIAGHDARDETSGTPERSPLSGAPRIARVRDWQREGSGREEHEHALGRALAGFGPCAEVELPGQEDALAAYHLVAASEAASNLARYDGTQFGLRVQASPYSEQVAATREEGFGAEAKRRLILGTHASAAASREDCYERAEGARRRLRAAFARLFADYDVLVGAAVPFGPLRAGEALSDPLRAQSCDRFLVPASLAGLPSLSVPIGEDAAGMPLALQLVAPAGHERTLLRLGAKLRERNAP